MSHQIPAPFKLSPLCRRGGRAVLVAVALCAGTNSGCRSKDKKEAEAGSSSASKSSPASSRSTSAVRPPAKPHEAPLSISDPDRWVDDGQITDRAREQLDLLLKQFTLAQLPEIWAFLKALPVSEIQKLGFYQSAIYQALRQGGFDDLKTLIENTLGPGEVRTKCLSALYSDSTADKIHLSARTAASPEDRAAIIAIIGNWGTPFSFDQVDWGSVGKLSAEEQEAIAKGMGSKVGAKARNEDIGAAMDRYRKALAIVDALIANGQAEPTMLQTCLMGGASVSPFDAWNEFQSRRNQFDLEMAGSTEGSLMIGLVTRDPAKAADLALSADVGPAAMGVLVQFWLRQDGRAATEWVASKWDSLTIPQADAVAISTMNLSLANGDLEGAAKWGDKARDPAARQKAQEILEQNARAKGEK